jgi:hypothetical protein
MSPGLPAVGRLEDDGREGVPIAAREIGDLRVPAAGGDQRDPIDRTRIGWPNG